MHKQLEDYLTEVERRLGSLPKQRCDEELKEMREHLLNAVSTHRELGQLEESAMANAMAEFGTPQEVGANILWAWRRHLREASKKSFVKMASIWSLFYVFMMLTSAHTLAQQQLVFCFWACTLAVFALFMIVPQYWQSRTQSPLRSSLLPRR